MVRACLEISPEKHSFPALAQSNVVFPKLTVADGARGALENRIGFLHVANELGDSAQVKLSIGTVVQKLILFKVKVILREPLSLNAT